MTAKIDSKNVDAKLANLPKKINNVSQTTLKSVIRFATNRLLQEAAKKTGIPQAVFRRRSRARMKIQPIANNGIQGIAWLGTNQFAARHVGKLQEIGTGAMAGNFFFDGGFIIKKGNFADIFSRKGKKRYPVKQEKVLVGDLSSVANNVTAQVKQRYAAELINNIKIGLSQ
jgi:hypothetical protein